MRHVYYTLYGFAFLTVIILVIAFCSLLASNLPTVAITAAIVILAWAIGYAMEN